VALHGYQVPIGTGGQSTYAPAPDPDDLLAYESIATEKRSSGEELCDAGGRLQASHKLTGGIASITCSYFDDTVNTNLFMALE
jgi:hypothetical protein